MRGRLRDGKGATVILIGGRMTVDDGSDLDSRQPIRDDPKSHVTAASLASSLLWWMTASSVVDPLLDAAGVDSFALVIGTRSVVEVRQDATLHRTGLRSLLRGGSTMVELLRTSWEEPLPHRYEEATRLRNWNGQVMGTVGFNLGKPGQRWRFLKGNDYYLPSALPGIGPAVIVDTSESLTGGFDHLAAANFRALEQGRLYDSRVTVVLPHTHRTEMLVRGYQAWLRAGRPSDEGAYPLVTSKWDPTAPPNSIRYTCPVPIDAAFAITGFLQDGKWRDPSGLEAARTLLQARYDLKLGIWDLVGNPTLRRTLLETLRVSPTPTELGDVPSGAAQRAQLRVAAKMKEATAESAAQLAIAKVVKPMRELGWAAAGPGLFRLPLTEALPRWPGDEPFPLVSLSLQISKRRSTVHASTSMYNQVDFGEYVLARRESLERIAAPEDCSLGPKPWPSLWRAPGGWADDVDWAQRAIELADRTGDWVAEFKSLCDDCRRVLQQRRSGS